jgi:hypothetical protein
MLLALIVVALVLTAWAGMRIERRRRTPAELRGDWWTKFEEEFRAYTSRLESSRKPRQRRNDHGPIGQ